MFPAVDRGFAPLVAVGTSTSQLRFRPGPLRGVLRGLVEDSASSAECGTARVVGLDTSKAVPAGLLRRLLRRVTFFLREKSHQKTRLKDAVWRLGNWTLRGLQNSDYDVVRTRLDSPGLRQKPKVALVRLLDLRTTRHRALRARRRPGGQSHSAESSWLRHTKSCHLGRAALVRITPRSCECHPRIRPVSSSVVAGILEPPSSRLLRTLRHLLRALLLTFLVIEKSKSPQDPAKRARAKSQLTGRDPHTVR
jgi:hypothetical protein